MSNIVVERLRGYVSSARNLPSGSFDDWRGEVTQFLGEALGKDIRSKFTRISGGTSSEVHKRRIGYLEGLMTKLQLPSPDSGSARGTPASPSSGATGASEDSKRVFLVHGHDNEAKQELARFCERLGLSPIILHEQAEKGRTIIEKFEDYADVRHAVVLLTPDDVGASASKRTDVHPRARQNVVFELGYFVGRLGRSRVSAMRKGDVEVPSDYHGVVYITLDDAGAWKTKLAQEFVQAGLTIDLKGLLQ